ncbi:amastin-like protein [Leishmania major strain Friedlin]|uniref:Amastin-like protein n=1 Tax=Leishmania major TaxID=5664 RepID=Q4QI88_LEIMA|nr:amastin-like protein [Leishmania major strain Friedlin]CAG9569379.1 amastin-like_protein [Leishmania major strain Friedlin]CAG9569380.1 amastin-like_protein [Leishmania major strain Friedlin]CAJ02260.1 amastin-like protein [Leishmania major strain Friedlin]|eukprot:XP_001681110.1 amastin-like protein [Leishmania major strain Friedlin]
MACRIGLLLYVISQLLAFLFVLVGTPIDMFRPHNTSRIGNTPCLTLWGYKSECYSTKYDVRSDDLWANCTDRLLQFRVAEALAVISIFVYGLAFIFGVLMLCCCFCLRWVCLTLNILGFGTLGVVWALMVVVYFKDDGSSCRKLSDQYHLGAGFALFVSTWCRDIFSIIFLLLPCLSDDSGNQKDAD